MSESIDCPNPKGVGKGRCEGINNDGKGMMPSSPVDKFLSKIDEGELVMPSGEYKIDRGTPSRLNRVGHSWSFGSKEEYLKIQKLKQKENEEERDDFGTGLRKNKENIERLLPRLAYLDTLSPANSRKNRRMSISLPSSPMEGSGSSVPALENHEKDLAWFTKYFLGEKHASYLGWDDRAGPFLISIMKDENPGNENILSTRAIIWEKNGIERILLPITNNKTHSPSEILKLIRPKLSRRKLQFVTDPHIQSELLDLEEAQAEKTFRFGCILMKENQTEPEQFFRNNEGSEHYETFLKQLGDAIELKGHKGYRGGLDVKTDATGTHSVFRTFQDYEIMFHNGPFLPYVPTDPQQVERRRFILNDVCVVVFQDGDKCMPFTPSLIPSQMTHVFIVVRAVKDGWDTCYRVDVITKENVPSFGPSPPEPPVFFPGELFSNFIIAKLINGQRAALCSAPAFTHKLRRTLGAQIRSIYDQYYTRIYFASASNSAKTRRRSLDITAMVGRNIKSDKVFLDDDEEISSRNNVMDITEIFGYFEEEIVCGDTFSKEASMNIPFFLTMNKQNNMDMVTILFATRKKIYSYDVKNKLQSLLCMKHICAIVVVEEINVVLLHSSKNSTLLVYELSSFLAGTPQLWQTLKHCSNFSVTVYKGDDYICSIYKKKLSLYKWNEPEKKFVIEKDYKSKEAWKQIDFFHNDTSDASSLIAVGTLLSSFVFFDWQSTSITFVYKLEEKGTLLRPVQMDDELLLSSQNKSRFVDYLGLPSRNFDMTWTSLPCSIEFSYPYVIGFSQQVIEVRTLINGKLVQMLHCPSIQFLSSKDGIFFASGNEKFRSIQNISQSSTSPFSQSVSPSPSKSRPSSSSMSSTINKHSRPKISHPLIKSNKF